MAAVAALRPILVRGLQLVRGPLARKAKEFGNETFKEFLKSNIVGWISKTAFGDDDAEIKEKVDTVMKELEHFEKAVQEFQTKINSQLAEVMTAIQDNHFNQKVDLVQRDVTTIEALFDKYVDGMKTLEQIASVPGNQSSHPDYRESRSTLTSVGQKITDEVYVAAISINKFLAGQGADSLLSLANAQSLRQNPDLWAHFCRMESIFLNHAFAQLKAVILFTFVDSDPEVSFSGASHLIQKVADNIQAQDEFMKELSGGEFFNIGSTCLSDKFGRAPISLEPHGGRGLVAGYGLIPPQVSQARVQWYLELVNPTEDLHCEKNNPFRLVQWNDQALSWTQFGLFSGDKSLSSFLISISGKNKIRILVQNKSEVRFCLGRVSAVDTVIWNVQPEALLFGWIGMNYEFDIKEYKDNVFGNALLLGERLIKDTWIESANKAFRLWFKSDGKVGIYSVSDGRMLWSLPIAEGSTISNVMVKPNFTITAYGDIGQKLWVSTNSPFQDMLELPQLKTWSTMMCTYSPRTVFALLTDEGKLWLVLQDTVYWSSDGQSIGSKVAPEQVVLSK